MNKLNRLNKAEISKEVFKLITGKMELFGLDFTPSNFNFSLEMFLEGVRYIDRKVGTK